VCIKCKTKEQFENVRLSDKKAVLFTWAEDYLTRTIEMPNIMSIVNFEGGGRMQCLMSDFERDEIELNMPVEMSFRILDSREGIHNYAWKCTPLRV